MKLEHTSLGGKQQHQSDNLLEESVMGTRERLSASNPGDPAPYMVLGAWVPSWAEDFSITSV